MLNAFYEETFPNLRYITFVNGRTRAEIVPELEVNIPPTLSSIHPSHSLTHSLTFHRESCPSPSHHLHKMQEKWGSQSYANKLESNRLDRDLGGKNWREIWKPCGTSRGVDWRNWESSRKLECRIGEGDTRGSRWSIR